MQFDAKRSSLESFSPTNLRTITITGIVFLGLSLPTIGQESESYELLSRPRMDTCLRVKTIVEVEGSLQVVSPGNESSDLPLSVRGELFFDERGLSPTAPQYVRHYWEAKADLDVGGEQQQRRLRDSRRLILLMADTPEDRTQFSSPLGLLTREELDLVDVTGAGIAPEQLLPRGRVREGTTWELDDQVAAKLLNVEKIQSGKLTCKLASISPATAKIQLNGRVNGLVTDVETQIEVVGHYHFDRNANIVNWLALSLEEQRQGSLAAPGFRVVSRVRTVRQPIDASAALDNEVTASIDPSNFTTSQLLEFVSVENDYRLAYDRRWILLSQHAEGAVLRMVDKGDLLATCKLSRLNRHPSDTTITLEDFQSDVQHALANHCDQISEAAESLNPQGVRTLRVVAQGEAGKVPIQWIYYHLSNEDGRRLSCIVTLEAATAQRFAGLDEALVENLEFLEGQDS